MGNTTGSTGQLEKPNFSIAPATYIKFDLSTESSGLKASKHSKPVRGKIYIAGNSNFSVDAISRVNPSIITSFVQTAPGVYTYILTATSSISGQTGTVVVTSIVTVINGTVKLTSILILQEFGTDIATVNMSVVPGIAIPESASMIFNTSAVFDNYSGTVVWSIDNSNYLAPKFTYTIKEPVPISGGMKTMPKLLNMLGAANVPNIKINQITTTYGADVLEVVVTITLASKQYSGQYPKNLIGKLQGNNLTDSTTQSFLKPVNFYSAMKGNGCHVIARAKSLIRLFNINKSLVVFYQEICDYMTVRYALSSLIYGTWTEKWLLEKFYSKFLVDLNVSEFAPLVKLFQPGNLYYDYQKYMRFDCSFGNPSK